MRIRSLVLAMAYLVVPVSLAADDRVIIGKMDFTDAEIGSATTEVSGYDVELIFERGAAVYGFTLGGYCHGTTQHLGIGLHPNFSTEGCVALTEEYEKRHNEAKTDGSTASEFDKDVIDVGQELWVLSARYNDPADLSWIATEGGLLSVFGQEFSLTDLRGALDMVTGEQLRELEEALAQDYVGLNQHMVEAEAEFERMRAQVSSLDEAVAGLREKVDGGATQEELQAHIAEQNFANFTDLQDFEQRAEEARDELQTQVASNVEHIDSLAEWADGVEDRLAKIEDGERDEEEFLATAESSETPGAEAIESVDDTSAAGSDTTTTIGDTISEVADATSWAWFTQIADQVRMVHLALGLAVLATIGVILLTFLKAPLRGHNKVKKAAESAQTKADEALEEAKAARAENRSFRFLAPGTAGDEEEFDPQALRDLPFGGRKEWGLQIFSPNGDDAGSVVTIAFVRTSEGVELHGLRRHKNQPPTPRSISESNFSEIPARLNRAAANGLIVGTHVQDVKKVG